jgi:hypothetical protein
MKIIILSLLLLWFAVKYLTYLFDVYGYRYEMKMRRQRPHATEQPSKPVFKIYK